MLKAIVLAFFAQVQLQVTLPSIRFEVNPPLVEVQPGVMVVPDYDEEVFYVDRAYWCRGRDGRWYRARDYRGGWIVAAPAMVPGTLVRLPPGRYKHHKGKPEKYQVVNPDGSVTEYKVKEKHGRMEVKEKGGKGRGHGRWK
jgi:hypothetical protein